jgi:putative endonuclease
MGRNNLVGAWGESLAAGYLQKKKYNIIASGYRCRYGEIDLIVTDKQYLVFVEVKLRKTDKFADAKDFVDFYFNLRMLQLREGKKPNESNSN